MTIEQICVQIDRRLAEARDEIMRLEAARDALGKGPDAAPAVAPGTTGAARPRTHRRARRAPRGATRQAVMSALVDGPAMTAGELAAATGLRREKIAPELTKLVEAGELVKADRGYRTPARRRDGDNRGCCEWRQRCRSAREVAGHDRARSRAGCRASHPRLTLHGLSSQRGATGSRLLTPALACPR